VARSEIRNRHVHLTCSVSGLSTMPPHPKSPWASRRINEEGSAEAVRLALAGRGLLGTFGFVHL
jgi:hypothetical protein